MPLLPVAVTPFWCFDHFEFGPWKASTSVLQMKLLTPVKQDLIKLSFLCFGKHSRVYEPSTTKVGLCRAIPEFVRGLSLFFPGLPKAGASLRSIWDVVLVPSVAPGWQL